MPETPETTAYRRIITDDNGQRRPILSPALAYDPNIQLGKSRGSDWPPCRCGSEVCPDREFEQARQ